MKTFLISCAMFLFIMNAHAQTQSNTVAFSSTAKSDNIRVQPSGLKHQQNNNFKQVSIAIENKHVVFSGLPAAEKTTWAVVTDMDGSYIKEKKVSPRDPVMDVHKLHGLYFVTLVYKNKNRNAFVLNL